MPYPLAKDSTRKLRELKIKACKLRKEHNMSYNEILKLLPLTRNQLKSAIVKWGNGDLGFQDLENQV